MIDAVQRGDKTGALGLINTSARDRFDTVRAHDHHAAGRRHRRSATPPRSNVTDTGKLIVWSLVGSALVVILAGLRAGLAAAADGHPAGRERSRPSVRRVAAGDYNAHGRHDRPAGGGRARPGRRRDAPPDRRRPARWSRRPATRSSAPTASSNGRPPICSGPTRTWSSSPTSPRTTCRSRCARWPASASCCSAATPGQLDERADQYIAFAVDGAHRMQRLINDLLAFSRIGRVTTALHRRRPEPGGRRRGRRQRRRPAPRPRAR